MKITYAAGTEEPRIEAILREVAGNNPDAVCTVDFHQIFQRPILDEREVSFRAPELYLSDALFEGRQELKMKGLSSKRSGKNTVVTIVYKLL